MWCIPEPGLVMVSSLLLFQSTHAVLKAERLLLNAGIPCTVIPVPKKISSECGICIVTDAGQAEAIRSVLSAAHVSAQWQAQEG